MVYFSIQKRLKAFDAPKKNMEGDKMSDVVVEDVPLEQGNATETVKEYTLDDLESKWISIKQGEEAIIDVERYEKVESPGHPYNFKSKEKGDLGYHDRIITTDGRELTINTFVARDAWRKAFTLAKRIKGKFKVSRPAHGQYIVEPVE